LITDRGLGHTELARRTGEIFMTRSGLEHFDCG